MHVYCVYYYSLGLLYTCYCNLATSLHLAVPNVPPHNVTVFRLNGTHINVSWVPLTLVEARGFIINYTVSVELSSGGEVVTVHVQENETSAVIGGLDPRQAYSVKVWASTVAGHGLPSNITDVKALESLISGN